MLRNWPSRIGDEARLKVKHSPFACGAIPLLAVVGQNVAQAGLLIVTVSSQVMLVHGGNNVIHSSCLANVCRLLCFLLEHPLACPVCSLAKLGKSVTRFEISL